MARIRSIKPETPTDKKLAQVSRDARLTFLYSLTIADDDGLFRAEPRQLLGDLFPHDADVTETILEAWCAELLRIGVLQWRVTRDGARVGELVNFPKHQQIKNRSKPFLIHQLAPVSVEPPVCLRTPSVGSPESVEKCPARSLESGVLSQESGVLEPPVGLAPDTEVVAVVTVKNGGHPRTAVAIREHLAATLSAVQAGQRDRLHADEMRTLQAELVFAYWQAKCGHERALLDDKRLTRLKRQLEENGGNVHELLYAVDGWAKDPTFRRLKDEGRELNGIQNIFTDRERIERLAGHCTGHRDGTPHAMAVRYLASLNQEKNP